MSERPILFSGAMVRAILEGRKTQTRRVIQSPATNMQRSGMQVIKHRAPGDPWYGAHVWSMRNRMGVWGDYTDEAFHSLCPYGAAGTRLWVRETWAPLGDQLTEAIGKPVVYRADADLVRDDSGDRVGWWLGDTFLECAARPFRWRSSIHMPRWASRLTLEVTEVRVQRLQEITEDDAIAEGIERGRDFFSCPTWRNYLPDDKDAASWFPDDPIGSLRSLWDSINGKRPGCSWGANPWVWAVSFRRLA